jgi:hypothetical protein
MNSFNIRGKREGVRKLIVIKQEVSKCIYITRGTKCVLTFYNMRDFLYHRPNNISKLSIYTQNNSLPLEAHSSYGIQGLSSVSSFVKHDLRSVWDLQKNSLTRRPWVDSLPLPPSFHVFHLCGEARFQPPSLFPLTTYVGIRMDSDVCGCSKRCS